MSKSECVSIKVRDISSETMAPSCVYQGKTLERGLFDDKWTFGKIYKHSGYQFINGVPIHRIVATAFHGEPKNPHYVVDHKNTNRQDNTPANLRWVTRYENLFLNPITCKKLQLLTGLTIDEIMQNPKLLENYKSSESFDWMRTVSPEESQNCYQNFLSWALNSEIKPTKERGVIGEYIYQTKGPPIQRTTLKPKKISNVYPCCPDIDEEQSLENYQRKLKPGSVFLRTKITEYIVIESVIFNEKLIVRSKDTNEEAVKPWFVSSVSLENGSFQATLVKSCFSKEGSKEFYDIAQDKPWESNHSPDYYY